MTTHVSTWHTVLAAVPLVPAGLDSAGTKAFSDAVMDRLRQRRIDGLLGKQRARSDVIDDFCDRIPEMLPSVQR